MSPPKVVSIGTPCKGSLPLRYITALEELKRTTTPELCFDWAASSTGSIAIARDTIVHRALTIPEVVGVLFLDDDMLWTPANVHRLISHNLPIVGACYSKKQVVPDWAMTGLPGGKADPQTGLMKVLELGTGCLYVAREVFEKVARIHRKRIMHKIPDPQTGKLVERFNYFWQGVEGQQFYGEDYGFCMLARKAGYEIFVDASMIVPHVGSIAYPISEDAQKAINTAFSSAA